MRQTICEGVWKSTIGNTPIKGASAFYFSVKSHVSYKKESVSLVLKNNFPVVIFIVNSYLPYNKWMPVM